MDEFYSIQNQKTMTIQEQMNETVGIIQNPKSEDTEHAEVGECNRVGVITQNGRHYS